MPRTILCGRFAFPQHRLRPARLQYYTASGQRRKAYQRQRRNVGPLHIVSTSAVQCRHLADIARTGFPKTVVVQLNLVRQLQQLWYRSRNWV